MVKSVKVVKAVDEHLYEMERGDEIVQVKVSTLDRKTLSKKKFRIKKGNVIGTYNTITDTYLVR